MCQIQVDTHLKTRVRIPTWDYYIDCSEVEIPSHGPQRLKQWRGLSHSKRKAVPQIAKLEGRARDEG